ncbi:MAG: inosine/xanthosine triphosphatase [Candidatus Sungbacteria bacterium]|nr:inosine/xanthosine triphosphatase [Candidatus Sungbacteria bacterium]
MKVAVGSHNPAKIEAVRMAFSAVWPNEEWEVFGTAVSSGIANQPMSDEESIRGAQNRARAARESAGADWGVGLEGGLHCVNERYFDCGWIIVSDSAGNEGIGSTARIIVPERVMALIHQGKELGDVNDELFGVKNSKQHEGYFGLMTKNAMTRAGTYRDGVIVALSRFVHPHLFDE